MTPSLFLIRYGTNEGYALEKMERAFYDVGVELADGASDQVHFGYANLERGAPRSLPAGFGNLVAFDLSHPSNADIERLAAYVRERRIELVVPFDLQPVHPLYRPLRHAGAKTIVGYWGAPISSLSPPWKLVAKRLEIVLSPHRADGLVFESRAMAALAVQGRGFPRRQVDIVPLGVDLGRYAPGPSTLAHEAFNFPPSLRIVVFAGHIYEGKGIGVLIEAALDLLERRARNDVCFLLLGNRAREHESFESTYAGRPCSELIRFGGYRRDVAEILRGCFCGVVPSLVAESYAFSGVEMAASGLPVVASRIGGLTDSVLDGVTGTLFEPGDARALADALEALLNAPDLAEKMGRAARARCERELSLAAHRARLLAVFRKRIKESRLAKWRF